MLVSHVSVREMLNFAGGEGNQEVSMNTEHANVERWNTWPCLSLQFFF